MLVADIHCDHHSIQINSILDMAKMLNPKPSAVYGPSNDQIKTFQNFSAEVKKEIETAKSIGTIVISVFDLFKSGETNPPEIDTPDFLEISAGFAIYRKGELNKIHDKLKLLPVTKPEKRKLASLVSELTSHLDKIENGFMDFRHYILHSRGQAPAFRASKKNMLTLVESSNNTNIMEDDSFAEV